MSSFFLNLMNSAADEVNLKMAFDEIFPEWFGLGRGRRSTSGWVDRWFSDFDQMFEPTFQDMAKGPPKEYTTETKLPDGSVVRQYGPLVYGYTVSIGPDGKSVIREFGNIKPTQRPEAFGSEQQQLEPAPTEARKPLVDIINDVDQIRVVAKLPGVNKSDIKTTIAEDKLIIQVETPTRKYYKEVQLPTAVDPDTIKASYNNGVLEIQLKQTKPKPKGKEVKID